MTTIQALIAATALAITLAGCSSEAGPTTDAADAPPSPPPSSSSSSPASPSTSPSTSPSGSSSAAAPTPSRSQKAESSEPAPVAVITIEDFAYTVPDGLEPGDEVMIENADDVAHTVTSREQGLFDVVVDGGSTATLTLPDRPGRYAFYCIYHANMEATLSVG